MKNKKKALKDPQESNHELLNTLAQNGFAEVLLDIDGLLRPIFVELVLLVAIKQVAQERKMTLREQLHIWRPFDV